jgi:hypothetical protein
MRTIDTSAITATAAMPLKKGILDHLQLGVKTLGELYGIAMISKDENYDTGIPYVITGLQHTVSGSTHTILSGYILYNGEVRYVQGATINLSTSYINVTFADTYQTDATHDPTQFSDASFHNVCKDVIGTLSQSNIATLPSTSWVYLNKVYKVTNPLTYGSPALNNKYNGTLYYSLKNQVLTISGYLVGSTTANSGDVLFTLPLGFRPSIRIDFVCTNNSSFPEMLANIKVATNGEVSIYTMNGDPTSLNARVISFANSLHLF